MKIEKPYFLKKPEWYYYDTQEYRYKLTDKATEEAKKSYEDYYAEPKGDVVIDF